MPRLPRPTDAPRLGELELAGRLAARPDRLRVARTRHGVVLNDYRDRAWDHTRLPGLPYAVYLARHGAYYLLAFDLDASKGDVARDAGVLRQLLSEGGIRFLEAVSGPTGGRHLLAPFRDGLPAGRVAALARHLRFAHLPTLDPTCLSNPTTGCIRPPGSPHRHGGRSVLVTPAATAAVVLGERNDAASFDRLCALAGLTASADTPALSRLPSAVLSPRLRRLQRQGDLEGRYRDRSSMAAAVALGYVNAGLRFEQFALAAHESGNVGLDHLRRVRVGPGRYRPRREAEVLAAAGRMWKGAQRYADEHPATRPGGDLMPGVNAAVVDAVIAAADAVPRRWSGQAGRSDRAVLDAFLDDASRWQSPEVPASVRRLAERSGLTRSTTARALQRLAANGWLKAAAVADGPHAATYRPAVPATAITAPTNAADAPHASSAVAPVGGTGWDTSLAPHRSDRLALVVATQSHDVFTSDGLGRYAAAVYTALVTADATPAGLAAATGLSTRTVRRHLQRLAAAGLAAEVAGTWRARSLEALDEAAARLGVTGTAARRAGTHAAERTTHHWRLAENAARRGWTTQRGLRHPGRHSLTGAAARPAPSVPFPSRPDSRDDPAQALRLVLASLGPAPDSLTLPHRAPRARAASCAGSRPALAAAA
ncbi:MAG: helix-turn-helix domain-containing protein [Actinomycetales bacterium]